MADVIDLKLSHKKFYGELKVDLFGEREGVDFYKCQSFRSIGEALLDEGTVLPKARGLTPHTTRQQ